MKHEHIYMVKNIKFTNRGNHGKHFFNGRCHVVLLVHAMTFPIPFIIQCVRAGGRVGAFQERLTQLMANNLQSKIKPQGVGVLVEACHIRTHDQNHPGSLPVVVTMATLGKFKIHETHRQEFLKFVKNRRESQTTLKNFGSI